jgi:hypothetical protein
VDALGVLPRILQQPAPTVSELRIIVRAKLPDYMTPSAFVLLEVLPRLPNSKVDRRALPMPDQARPELERAFTAPRTPVEEALAEIWMEVLGLAQVGIHDDFLELGGHSLSATRITARVRVAFQVEIPLRSFFGKPTIAEFSVLITRCQAEKVAQEDLDRMLIELDYRKKQSNNSLPTKAYKTRAVNITLIAVAIRRGVDPALPLTATQTVPLLS